MKPGALPFMSIVVCSYNGADTLARTLRSIEEQTYPKDRYEVVVVNDGSTDSTAAIAASFPVRLVNHAKNRGIAPAHNTGLAAVKGEIFVGIDDDTIVSPNLLTELADVYATQPDAAGVSSLLKEPKKVAGLADNYLAAGSSGNPASIDLDPEQNIVRRFFAYLKDQARPKTTPKEPFPVSRIYGATSSFPIEVLKAVHGWDDAMTNVEDTDLCTRILKQFPDLRFYTTPKTFVIHDPKPTVYQLLRRAYTRGPVNLAYYRKNGLVPPFFPFPIIWTLLNAALLITAPLLGLLSLVLLPQVLYFWWPIRAFRQKKWIYLGLPYLQLGEELASLSGIILGYTKMLNLRNTAKTIINNFKTDSLFRNAVFLMTSTAITSVLGFGFWLFITHFYTPEDIGAASALISVSLIIQYFSFLGLDTGLVRFLPKSKNQSGDINATLIVVTVASAVAALIYSLLNLNSNLPFFQATPLNHLILVAFMVIVALNSITDNVFIANRRAGFHTITYGVVGVTKLILPVFLISLGSLGIFAAYVASSAVSLILTYFFMRRAAGYRFIARPEWKFITSTRKFVSANYSSKLISSLPQQIMPVLILSRLGAADTAYFSMAWTMANLLYVVPSATSNSLLAESSANISKHKYHVARSIKLLSILLLPAILLAVVVAPYLLHIFGPKYAAHATTIFQLLTLMTVFVAVNYVGAAILNVAKRTTASVVTQIAIAIFTLGFVFPLMRYGLVGVGIAMVIGQIAGNISLLVLLVSGRKNPFRRVSRTSKTGLKHSAKLYNLL